MNRPAFPNSPFLAACRGERPTTTPVWFMRQAGRALPEYREVKKTATILEVLRDPAAAAEITLQPVRRYGVDAAVLYSDIVVPVWAIGFGVDLVAGVGPVIAQPFAGPDDLARLRPLEPEVDTPWLLETISILTQDLEVPLIGFAGAPFTVASYLIEGGPSREFAKTKSLMYNDPELWGQLMDRLADLAIASIGSQVAAGVSAIQLFDSWVGALSAADYRRYVLPWSARVLGSLEGAGIPRIHFGVNTGELLGLMGEAGADVVGVDWRVDLADARARVAPGKTLQGNLDPACVTAGWQVARHKALEVLEAGRGGAHIFNLGHGVTPSTDPEVLTRLVELVHTWQPDS